MVPKAWHNTILRLVTLVLVMEGASPQDCIVPTSEQLKAVLELIISSEGLTETPAINVTDFHVVCLAASKQRDHYRGLSVIVKYTCSGNSDCPVGNAEEQIESECSSGQWSIANSIQSGRINESRSQSSLADFSTAVRENCALCLSPELAVRVSLNTDSITHCVG